MNPTVSPVRHFALVVYFIVLVASIARCAPLRAEESGIDARHQWPQWRGPLANGVAPDADPPLQWDATKNIQWTASIAGAGNGTPIVWGDKVFLLTAVDTKLVGPIGANSGESAAAGRGGFGPRLEKPKTRYQFMVVCLDRETGKTLWERVACEAVPNDSIHDDNSYASASPTTDGKRLYVSFGSQGIYCYDLQGELIWSRDLGDMQTRNGFGEGTSPTIHGDTLIVNWDHEGPSFITALDAATGEEKWKQERDEVTTWNTPLVVEAFGRTQVIVNATNRSRAYDLQTGEVIWECGGQVTNPIPSPISADGIAYLMSGYRGAALYAIRLDAKGDVSNSKSVVWKRTEGTPYVPSAVLSGHRLYFTKSNNGILSCIDVRDGRPIIDQQRVPGLTNVYASPVAANGRIYFLGRDGTSVVIRDADELEVLATN
ncbi:MAG: PQQ-like beta-propeller repeat protein, partial [Planctomycetales bacterium]|nr:PQQ-like beta-propeller repeat protein [Planctomycetales bacterium]